MNKEEKITEICEILKDILTADDITITIDTDYRQYNGKVVSTWKGISLATTKVSTPKLENEEI